jgi:hypothetical protein
MARDLWLAILQDIHEVADANFSVGNQVQEPKPGAIGKGAEKEMERGRFGF